MSRRNATRAWGVSALAAATHAAEDEGDDITFVEIQDEVENRPPAEREEYRLEYIRGMAGAVGLRTGKDGGHG